MSKFWLIARTFLVLHSTQSHIHLHSVLPTFNFIREWTSQKLTIKRKWEKGGFYDIKLTVRKLCPSEAAYFGDRTRSSSILQVAELNRCYEFTAKRNVYMRDHDASLLIPLNMTVWMASSFSYWSCSYHLYIISSIWVQRV